MLWYDRVWYGMMWYGMVCYAMVWYGMVWYGFVQYPCNPICNGIGLSIEPKAHGISTQTMFIHMRLPNTVITPVNNKTTPQQPQQPQQNIPITQFHINQQIPHPTPPHPTPPKNTHTHTHSWAT